MESRRYLYGSLLLALLVVGLKGLAWRLTGSVGLLSDAMESLVNVVAAAFALFMLDIAARPPDQGHPFGHGKAEYFSSAAEGLMIGLAALLILFEAGRHLLQPQPVQRLGPGLVLVALASVGNAALGWRMLAASRRLRSIVLEADARHLLADVWTSVAVILGVLLVPLTGRLWLDPAIGILVALHILWQSWHLLARSVDGLMDHSLSATDLNAVEAVLAPFRSADVRFDHIRTRRAGSRRFVSLHMHLPAHWTLGRAARARREVEQALTDAIDGIGITIETLPHGSESLQDETEASTSALHQLQI